MKNKDYIEFKNNIYKIKDSRVSLDSVIYAFLNGMTPEGIAQSFPVLSLEQIYGTITYYLANKNEIDNYLKEGDLIYEKQRIASLKENQSMIEKLNNARGVRV